MEDEKVFQLAGFLWGLYLPRVDMDVDKALEKARACVRFLEEDPPSMPKNPARG